MIQLNILRSLFLAFALTFVLPVMGMNVGLLEIEAAQAQAVARKITFPKGIKHPQLIHTVLITVFLTKSKR